jgi:regulator of sigma E protease
MLERAVSIGTVVLGLGFVIFIHELGHFLLAKWNGVKVELFSLGFGPALISFRKGVGVRLFGSTTADALKKIDAAEAAGTDPDALGLGETEYSIRAIPLGGFVKMLGEGEGPESEGVRSADPRAYPNKPVGSRMAIISAGVIMNLLSAVVFFIWVFGRGGLPVVPARIGGVFAGHPAYAAGLRAGDEIVAVDGRGDLDFLTLKRITAMSGPGQVLHLQVRRPGVEAVLPFDVEPRRVGAAESKTMGILPPSDLTFGAKPLRPSAGLPDLGSLTAAFKPGDEVVAAGPAGGGEPAPVTTYPELFQVLGRDRDRPVELVARRGQARGAGASQVEATLPVVPFVDFGFRLTTGAVAVLQPDGPAARAGFRVNDRIVAVEGVEELDPMRLPDVFWKAAGKPIGVDVARSEGGKPEVTVHLTVTPTADAPWVQVIVDRPPLDIPGLGMAVEVVPVIAGVRPGSPAASAGLQPGDTLASLATTGPDPENPSAKPDTLEFTAEGVSYPAAFYWLQTRPVQPVALKLANRAATVTLTAAPDPSWTNPMHGLRYGSFETLERPLPPLGTAAAVSKGLTEALDWIESVYAMFRSLANGSISPKALGGPLAIGDAAYHEAKAGFSSFLRFLGILSVNLAVLNFLPIPPLDGGQMVFLLAEKVRGRPLSEKAMNLGTVIGLVLVLGLMAFVIFQDLSHYIWQPG